MASGKWMLFLHNDLLVYSYPIVLPYNKINPVRQVMNRSLPPIAMGIGFRLCHCSDNLAKRVNNAQIKVNIRADIKRATIWIGINIYTRVIRDRKIRHPDTGCHKLGNCHSLCTTIQIGAGEGIGGCEA